MLSTKTRLLLTRSLKVPDEASALMNQRQTNVILVFPSQPQGQYFHQFRARQRRKTPLRRRPMHLS